MSKKITIAYLKTDFLNEVNVKTGEDADAFLIASGNFKKVCIKDELSGRSEALLRLGRLTAAVKGVCFAALVTDNFGLLRKSVAVFERGKFIKLVDATLCEDKNYSPSYGYKTISSGGVRYGVAVGNDITDPACLNCLSMNDSDVIINLSADFYDYPTENLMSALSYLYGVTVASVGSDKTVVAERGRIITSTSECVGKTEVTIKKIYREYTVKRRGST